MLSSGVLSLSLLSSLAAAATVTYDWNVTWVTANPDGQAVRPVIGINGQWPCPLIEATVGDTVVVTIHNQLGNETTGLHFHGINMVHTPEMDGPSGTTQCAVPPNSYVTYEFVVDAPGTYWYHSHNMGQYPDGLRGPMVVQDPNDPYGCHYDEEIILTVSDWYHQQSIDLMRGILVTTNTKFLPPFPDNILLNEGTGANYTLEEGKTYRVRLISFSAFASAMVHFGSHPLNVIMNDGAYLQEVQVDQLRITPAQRYDFLISVTDSGNYPFLVSLDFNRDFSNPNGLTWPLNATGYVIADPMVPLDSVTDVVGAWQPADDSKFAPLDGLAAYGPVTQTIQLDFQFCRDANNLPRACFNNQSMVPQKVPSLYTAVTTGDSNTDPSIYGDINPFIVNYGDVVEIVVNNHDGAVHPFHLHGHHFQVLERPASGSGLWTGHDGNIAQQPPKRDTVSVMANSFAVLRYVANNPGVFLFHCHIEWHVEMGLTATIIEAPDQLRGLTFPDDHINNCKLQDIPYQGNAGGNTQNLTDTSNFNTILPAVYTGALYTAPNSKRSRMVKWSA